MARPSLSVTVTTHDASAIPDAFLPGIARLKDFHDRGLLDIIAELIQIRRQGGYCGLDVFIFLEDQLARRTPTQRQSGTVTRVGDLLILGSEGAVEAVLFPGLGARFTADPASGAFCARFGRHGHDAMVAARAGWGNGPLGEEPLRWVSRMLNLLARPKGCSRMDRMRGLGGMTAWGRADESPRGRGDGSSPRRCVLLDSAPALYARAPARLRLRPRQACAPLSRCDRSATTCANPSKRGFPWPI